MDIEWFDAIVKELSTGVSRRRVLAGALLGGLLTHPPFADMHDALAKNKKKDKKKKKKQPDCPASRRKCGGQCIPFSICCHNGSPGCPPCHLCSAGTCQLMDRPSCPPCQEPVCQDGAFQCVDKSIPTCTGCQQAECKDGTYQCVTPQGVFPCGDGGVCCDPENPVCCPAGPGKKTCIARYEACGFQDCRYPCSGGAPCCDTVQKCCPGPNNTTICVLVGEPCP